MRTLVVLVILCLASSTGFAAKSIPVIFDSDIGGDIDDTWALAYLLRSPELDLNLLVTDYGDTLYRAKVAAKLLEVVGSGEVPIGIGLRQSAEGGPQQEWVADYDLENSPGIVHEDDMTVEDGGGPKAKVAMRWRDRDALETQIVERLITAR